MTKSIVHIFFSLALIFLLSSCGTLLNLFTEKVKINKSNSEPISHEVWNDLLGKHVKDSRLDYKGIIADSTEFNGYLSQLKSSLPNDKYWSKEEQFAYWINAYNAFTVKLIVDNYPITSIKDIKGGLSFVNSVWDVKFIEIEGQKFDLNNIEHGILREQFKDPRIHFAVNCASISCPALINEAFQADKLEEQLDMAAKSFFLDASKNKLTSEEAQISKIFKWFKKDFTKDQSLKEFIDLYTEQNITKDTKITYLDYDWNLNDVED